MFDDRWRIVATVRAGDANPKEAFAYHAAGFAGSGGSSYIDSVIMREKDSTYPWTSASDGTLEERVYYVQNWRSDVVALLDASGNPLEEIRYSAYGSPSVHPIADVNHDGLVNSTDQSVWGDLFNEIPSTGVYAHNNLNRDELFPGDLDDDNFFNARYSATSGGQYGFRKLSSLGNRKGYAGYEWDVSATVWHVRHRVLDSASGKWTRMDPLGYVDAGTLYEYVGARVLQYVDPDGLQRRTPGDDLGNPPQWPPFTTRPKLHPEILVPDWLSNSASRCSAEYLNFLSQVATVAAAEAALVIACRVGPFSPGCITAALALAAVMYPYWQAAAALLACINATPPVIPPVKPITPVAPPAQVVPVVPVVPTDAELAEQCLQRALQADLNNPNRVPVRCVNWEQKIQSDAFNCCPNQGCQDALRQRLIDRPLRCPWDQTRSPIRPGSGAIYAY